MPIHLIALLCVFNHSCFGGSRMAIALYALDLGASQFDVGVLMAFYALFPVFLAIWVGKLVDRIGPRNPMMYGSLGVGLATLLPSFFPSLATLYFCSLLIGFSFHFFFIAVNGVSGGIGGPENRTKNYAVVSIGFSSAAFLGPFTTGFAIDHFGFLTAFQFLSALTFVPFLLLLLKPDFLPGPNKQSSDRSKNKITDLWKIPQLQGAFIASGILSSGLDLFQFYFPVYGHSIGLSASIIGTVMACFAVATFSVRLIIPYFVKHWGEAVILMYGIFIAAFAIALFPFFANPWILGMIAFVLGLGLGSGQPMSMSLIYVLAPDGRSSEAAGLRIMINNMVHFSFPLVFGGLGTALGYFPVFLSNSALLMSGAAFLKTKYNKK